MLGARARSGALIETQIADARHFRACRSPMAVPRTVDFADKLLIPFDGRIYQHAIALGDVDRDGVSAL